MITAEQRAERKAHIGSSDAPAIVGVDPWKTKGDVYWNKLSDIPDTPSEAMQMGNWMEPVLLNVAEARYGLLRRDVSVIAAKHEELAANLDGKLWGAPIGIEAKYVGPKSIEKWGEPETDEIPDHVAIQCQHQMYVAGLSEVHVIAGLCDPNRGLHFEFYHIPRDEDLIEDLVTAELHFWKYHVLAKVPPENSPPSPEVLKRLRREPGSIVDLDLAAGNVWQARIDAAAIQKAAGEAYDLATAAVLELLADNEAGRLPDGSMIVYALENAGLKLANAKEAQTDCPDLFIPSTRRVLRLKKAPKK